MKSRPWRAWLALFALAGGAVLELRVVAACAWVPGIFEGQPCPPEWFPTWWALCGACGGAAWLATRDALLPKPRAAAATRGPARAAASLWGLFVGMGSLTLMVAFDYIISHSVVLGTRGPRAADLWCIVAAVIAWCVAGFMRSRLVGDRRADAAPAVPRAGVGERAAAEPGTLLFELRRIDARLNRILHWVDAVFRPP